MQRIIRIALYSIVAMTYLALCAATGVSLAIADHISGMGFTFDPQAVIDRAVINAIPLVTEAKGQIVWAASMLAHLMMPVVGATLLALLMAPGKRAWVQDYFEDRRYKDMMNTRRAIAPEELVAALA